MALGLRDPLGRSGLMVCTSDYRSNCQWVKFLSLSITISGKLLVFETAGLLSLEGGSQRGR